MSVPLAEKIIGLFKEGLSAYKTYLATRQEAYNRKRDKEQVRAIEAGEKYILINKDQNISPEKKIKILARYEKRFFKYH